MNTQERMREIERRLDSPIALTSRLQADARFLFDALKITLDVLYTTNCDTNEYLTVLKIRAALASIEHLAQRGEGGSE